MKKNDRIILTGASSGIGEQIAYLLVSRGHLPVLVASNEKKLFKVAETISSSRGVTCPILVCDLSMESEVEKLIESYPETDILINNAGFSMYGKYHNLPWERIKKMIAVNSIAPARLCHYYLQGMILRQHGKILNIASTTGFYPTPYVSVYAASKSFLIQLSKSLALEAEGSGVLISCLLPGPTDTGFWEVAKADKKVEKARVGYDSPVMVATYGLKILDKGIRVGTPGWKNKFKQIIKYLIPGKIWALAIKKHMLHDSLNHDADWNT